MSNLCSILKPSAETVSNWQSDLKYYGVYSPFIGNAKAALTVPFVFDADTYGISCVAFANNASAGTLLSYQTQINTLQTTVSNLNTQLQALTAGTQVIGPNPEILQAEAVVFGASLAAAAAVYGLKRIYNLFRHESGENNG